MINKLLSKVETIYSTTKSLTNLTFVKKSKNRYNYLIQVIETLK